MPSLDNEFYRPGMRCRADARRVSPALATLPVHLPFIAPPHAALRLLLCIACTVAVVPTLAQQRGLTLVPSQSLHPAPDSDQARRDAPVYLQADSLRGQPEATLEADGKVEFRHGRIVIRADQLRYDQAEDLAVAEGKVHISFNGSVFEGPEVQMHVQRVQGFMRQTNYTLAVTGAGGHADRVDFLGPTSARVINGNYTSCPRDGPDEPDWVLSAQRLTLDSETSTGVAEGAELRFLGVPILALPTMSFPLSDQRKSGWLPPTVDFTTGSGVEVGVPYYWNIAPNRDATIAPSFSTRRGFGLDTEARYLGNSYQGKANLDWLPYDQVAERSRYWLTLDHHQRWGADTRLDVQVERVSDDRWWNDFPRRHDAFTPRLLPASARVERDFAFSGLETQVYAAIQQWQPLQIPNTMESPFGRAPQVGLHGAGSAGMGLEYSFESEFNRFVLPSDPGYTAQTLPSDGNRVHALGQVSRPFREPGWWVTPRLLFNAASYRTDEAMSDGRFSASRTIPTASVGAGAEFERPTRWGERALRQTLEPRLLYVDTPYVQQTTLPKFDSAIKDFSFASIFSENDFSGVDRVSDTNGLTVGAITRLLDASSGAELMQLGVAQRYLFRRQRITDTGVPEKAGFSDVLLRGSTRVIEPWSLDAYLRYSPSAERVTRAIVGAQYTPGNFRTINMTYRYATDISSQVELGWQWPLYEAAGHSRGGTSCAGSWYSVGRVLYSITDRQVTDGVLGVEYDAGCWVARLAVSRVSTGVSQASTQLLMQLELVGLARLGTNVMNRLRDNIPGYQLLRANPGGPPASAFYD